MGDKEFGIDPKRIAEYAEEIKAVAELGVQAGVVIGGGNIFRGSAVHHKAWTGFKQIIWVC